MNHLILSFRVMLTSVFLAWDIATKGFCSFDCCCYLQRVMANLFSQGVGFSLSDFWRGVVMEEGDILRIENAIWGETDMEEYKGAENEKKQQEP